MIDAPFDVGKDPSSTMQDLDPAIYPRAVAHLERLPAGIESHPDATCVADVLDVLLEDFPQFRRPPGVSARVQEWLDQEYTSGMWVPEMRIVTTQLMARDLYFRDDEHFVAWSHDMSVRVFKKPLYRMLMYVLSPTLVLMGAQKRWSRFRRGSTMSGRPHEDGSYTLAVDHPDGIYSPMLLDGLGASYQAALEAAGAKNVDVAVVASEPTRSEWRLTWG